MEELKVAKLVSGEFVIGRELSNGLLVNVFKIDFSFDQKTGQPIINIFPFMFPVNDNLDYFISPDKIICMDSAGEKLKSLYIQQITAVLQQAAQESESKKENHTEEIKEEPQPKKDEPSVEE